MGIETTTFSAQARERVTFAFIFNVLMTSPWYGTYINTLRINVLSYIKPGHAQSVYDLQTYQIMWSNSKSITIAYMTLR